MSVLLYALAALFSLAGVVGCVVPALPGPPISFVAMILLWAARGWDAVTFGWPTVVAVALATIVVTVVDTVAPAIGARRYGASRLGVWGSVIGMILGILFFPPLGMILGAFVGALAGEVVSGKDYGLCFRAAWGVFVYTMLGIVLKLAVSLTVIAYLILELVRG